MDSIVKLLTELGRPKPKTVREKKVFEKLIRTYIYDKDKRLLVAYDGPKMVGLISMLLLKRLNQTKLEMYVPELVVLSKYQRMGIGKKLVSRCILLARKEKCFRIRLESGYPRTSSHRFYKKIGFVDYAITFKKALS
jgi:GNAT superfamily N-acetyltransferase